jgi:membrane associated rhomboid family serine protease
MTPAAVGLRCPEHSGRPQGVQRVRQSAARIGGRSTAAVVTQALVALNVGVYLAELAAGGTVDGTGNRIYEDGALVGVLVADGDWWRLLTAAFLHYGPIHLGMNMLALWWFGQPLEHALGRGRFLLLYLVSGLAGSAGALLLSSMFVATVGASGAIFGILGAALVLERQGSMVFGGQALTLIVINLVFTFAVGNISVGGHIGGLIGGILCLFALSRFGRGHAIHGRPGVLGIGSAVAIGVLSVVVAYWRVRGYA